MAAIPVSGGASHHVPSSCAPATVSWNEPSRERTSDVTVPVPPYEPARSCAASESARRSGSFSSPVASTQPPRLGMYTSCPSQVQSRPVEGSGSSSCHVPPVASHIDSPPGGTWHDDDPDPSTGLLCT